VIPCKQETSPLRNVCQRSLRFNEAWKQVTAVRTCIHTYTPTCLNTYIHTYTHTYIHTYVHILTYIHNGGKVRVPLNFVEQIVASLPLNKQIQKTLVRDWDIYVRGLV